MQNYHKVQKENKSESRKVNGEAITLVQREVMRAGGRTGEKKQAGNIFQEWRQESEGEKGK